MNAMQLLTGPLAQSIGWALLHLVWQATIVAGILAAALALLPRESAKARYAASCGALALVVVFFVATAVRAFDPGIAAIVPTPSTPLTQNETVSVPLSEVPVVIARTAAASWSDRATTLVTRARQSLPSVVAVWLMGVLLLSFRLLVSLVRTQRMAARGSHEASAEWQEIAVRLSAALGLRRAVRLLESATVEVPSVLGSLRPIVLLPASTLTGMTPEQIEMVLAHELAHIRRHDFLVNLAQALVETLMFYHPAVWWISNRIRVERENCCDDLAVGICGNPIQYARALTRLEELRGGAPAMSVAANGGSLLDRIRRIAVGRAESTSISARWTVGIAALAVLLIALAIPSLPALAQREKPKKTETPKAASSKVDVEAPATTPRATDCDVNNGMDNDVDYDIDVDPPEIPEPPDVDVEMPDVEVRTPNVDVEVPEIDIALPHVAIAPRAVAMEPVSATIAAAPSMAFTPFPSPAPRAAEAPPAPPAPRATPAPAPPAAPSLVAMWAADEARQSGRGDEPEKEFGANGKLTVDELIRLRSVGVTPEYVASMRSVFPGVTLGQIMRLRAVGVTPDYVREMRAAGFDAQSARDYQTLRAVGVTGEYIRAMKSAGVEIKTARDAASLRSMGVAPEWVKQLAAAGYSNLTVKELIRLAAAGVDADFIREMEKYRTKK